MSKDLGDRVVGIVFDMIPVLLLESVAWNSKNETLNRVRTASTNRGCASS